MYGSLHGVLQLPIERLTRVGTTEQKENTSTILSKKLKENPELREFFRNTIDLDYLSSYCTEVTTVESDDIKVLDNDLQVLINYAKVNNFRRINQYFIEANNKLSNEGVFYGNFESITERHIRLAKKYFYLPKWFLSFYDFSMFRVIPKLPQVRKLFFNITKGKNRAITTAEMLGRLSFCGFDLVNLQEINNRIHFIAVKRREPSKDVEPSYGPLFKMKRIGFEGRELYVYKFRTMHPYSEYLQKFIHDNFNLKEGGKFNEDFRITTWGKFLRKFWLDELPMILNFLKGELKLVGVRPLSSHYISLYTPEMAFKRLKVKPGLVPPYYVDLPTTIAEIQESESRYIDSYLKNPVKTDFVYFWKAFYNILIKHARSS